MLTTKDPQYQAGYEHGRTLFEGARTLMPPSEFYSRLQRAIVDTWRILHSPAVEAEADTADYIWLRGYLHAQLDIQCEALAERNA